MKKNKILKIIFWIAIILIIEFSLTYFTHVDLSEGIGEPRIKINSIMGFKIPINGINIVTVLNTWLIMAFLVISSYFMTRKLKPKPGRLQMVGELFVTMFDTLCKDVLGEKLGRKYLPFVATLFIFILCSNWLGIIPNFWLIVDGVFPKWMVLEEPTRDLNTTLGFGLMCFFVAHISGIIIRGPVKYLKEFFEPSFQIGKVTIPNIPMGFLNIIGEFGKTISHSFRLFGNIFGGAIIFLVLSGLSISFFKMLTGWPIGFPIGPPIFLNAFFGLFGGTIQAFVFSMLALVYVSLMVSE